jgi:hypothetical protein
VGATGDVYCRGQGRLGSRQIHIADRSDVTYDILAVDCAIDCVGVTEVTCQPSGRLMANRLQIEAGHVEAIL